MTPIFQPTAFQGSAEYDPNAVFFFNATAIQNVGLKDAVNQLVVDLKSAGLWNKMDCIYPFVTDQTGGGALEDFSFNLINTASYNGTFINGTTNDTQDASGFKVNGMAVNKTYMKTGLIPSTVAGGLTSPYHLSMYTNATSSESTNAIDCGGNNVANQTNIYLGRTFAGTPASVSSLRGFAEIVATNQAVYKGHFIATITGSTAPAPVHALYRDAVLIASSSTAGNNCGSVELYIGGANQNGTLDAAASKRYQFFSFGGALVQSEVTAFTQAVQKFQSAVDVVMSTSRRV